MVLSSDLLQGQKELLIEHAGEVYRLRLTRNDKLILQK
jgi:hemin uptake protein HemP